jgi:AhpD family alkylhydroperoxidase
MEGPVDLLQCLGCPFPVEAVMAPSSILIVSINLFRFPITFIYNIFDSKSNPKQKEVQMATPSKLHDQISDMWDLYRKCLPDVAKAYDELPMEVYKDGALPGKIKRLMALTGALVHGCRACLLFQTDQALAAGATVEEILEACAVAISLGGTMGAGETTRVVEFLHKKGLLSEFK